MVKKKPRGETVYTVTFQLVDCCNSVGVFKTSAQAIRWITRHSLFSLLTCGAGEYADTALKKYRVIMANIEYLELHVRQPLDADEIWIDLKCNDTVLGISKILQTALFTVTKLTMGDTGEAGEDEIELPFIHPAPAARQ